LTDFGVAIGDLAERAAGQPVGQARAAGEDRQDAFDDERPTRVTPTAAAVLPQLRPNGGAENALGGRLVDCGEVLALVSCEDRDLDPSRSLAGIVGEGDDGVDQRIAVEQHRVVVIGALDRD
jgi:hypothetical protein